jgi:hypothetical protein
LGPSQAVIVAPAKKRLQVATRMAHAISAIQNSVLQVPSAYPCWMLLVKCLAVKLDFDFRVSAPSLRLPIAHQFKNLLSNTAASILGFSYLPEEVFQQMSLPGKLSGLGLRNPLDTVLAAPVASVMQVRRPAFLWLKQFAGFSDELFLKSYNVAHAQYALACLEKQGISIGARAEVSLSPLDFPLSLQSVPTATHHALQGKITGACHQQRFLKLFQQAGSMRHRTRLLSASGFGNGACWENHVDDENLAFIDLDFRIATLYRVGMPICPLGAKCKHHSVYDFSRKTQKTQDDTSQWCNKSLDHPDHPLMCKRGASVQRTHRAICQLLAKFCREAGLDTRLEVVVPEFIKPVDETSVAQLHPTEGRKFKSAILDVHATHPYLSKEFLLDATVRHPMASNAKGSDKTPGVAASLGEHDKLKRYPPTRRPACHTMRHRDLGQAGQPLPLLITDTREHSKKSGRHIRLAGKKAPHEVVYHAQCYAKQMPRERCF